MDGPGDYHTKWSKSDRYHKYHMISLISRILKNDTNGFIYKTETDSVLEEELMVSKVGRLWGGTDWEFGIDLNTLLYLK